METHNSLFIASTSIGLVSAPRSGAVFDGKQSRFYHLIRAAIARQGSIQGLAHSLVRLCEIAYGQRDLESLEDASEVLCNLPLESAQQFGQYYQALIATRCGQFRQAEFKLEPLTSSASEAIRSRALQTLAIISAAENRTEKARELHAATIKTGYDSFALTGALMNLSALESTRGNHRQALDGLVTAWPIVRAASRAHPYLFFAYHNEVAYELLQLGQVEQAAKYSQVATSSPIIDAYPEWRETKEQIIERQSAPITIAVLVSAPFSADEETEEIQPSLLNANSEAHPACAT